MLLGLSHVDGDSVCIFYGLDSKFDEQKDQAAVEWILRVVVLYVECPSPALEKLKHQLGESPAVESHKKSIEDTGPKFIGEGLVRDEWIQYKLELWIASANMEDHTLANSEVVGASRVLEHILLLEAYSKDSIPALHKIRRMSIFLLPVAIVCISVYDGPPSRQR